MYSNIFIILFCPCCNNAILFCQKKQGNLVLCYNMDELEDGKLIETSVTRGRNVTCLQEVPRMGT
jgi:hypothetical protein